MDDFEHQRRVADSRSVQQNGDRRIHATKDKYPLQQSSKAVDQGLNVKFSHAVTPRHRRAEFFPRRKGPTTVINAAFKSLHGTTLQTVKIATDTGLIRRYESESTQVRPREDVIQRKT